MKLYIVTDGFELTEEIRKLIRTKFEQKLSKHLQHFEQDMKKATLTLEQRTRWGYKANFKMTLPEKESIAAQAIGEEILYILTDLRDKVEQQITTYKGKIRERR